MDHNSLASGDNNVLLDKSTFEQIIDTDVDEKQTIDQKGIILDNGKNISSFDTSADEINAENIKKNEAKMKERLAQIKTLIVSLKSELKDEKSNLEEARKHSQFASESITHPMSAVCEDVTSFENIDDLCPSATYTACIDTKLFCDENLMEYEKQLQIYQNTLNMAQIEKKNAIRKQMLAKAYKLKLLEVENQCNIELLRVKQSLQCLEPLQMIAKNWEFNKEDFNLNNYDLIPRFPELKETNAIVNMDDIKDNSDDKPTKN